MVEQLKIVTTYGDGRKFNQFAKYPSEHFSVSERIEFAKQLWREAGHEKALEIAKHHDTWIDSVVAEDHEGPLEVVL